MKLGRKTTYIFSISLIVGLAAIPVFAEKTTRTFFKKIILQGPTAFIQQQGSKPVKIKDDLKVTGNITVNDGKTIDGVDVSALQNSIINYTAGSGITITAGSITSTLDTTIESAEITDGTITAADLGVSSIGADQLSTTAIQVGDIEVADLPTLATANLSDAANISMLSEHETITGNWVNTANPWADNEVVDSLTISGGAIDNTPLGASTASTGNFSNLTMNDTALVLAGVQSVPAANTTTVVDATSDYVGQSISVTIGADGFPVMAYIDVTNRDLKLAHCENITCTSSTITTISTDARLYAAIIIGADGFPVVLHDRWGSGEVVDWGISVLKCGNRACTSGNVDTVVNSDYPLGLSVSIGTDGLPVLSYINVTDTDLTVVKCGNALCSASNITTDVDPDNVYTFGNASIAVAPDGFPVIAYYTNTGNDLKVAKCTNVSCSTKGTQTVDSTNDVGKYASLVISADGFPVVSYFDETNDNLMVVKCANATCAGATGVAVDSTGNVGKDNSITLGPDGYPLISYTDETNATIKLIKCGDAACTPSSNVVQTIASLGTTPFSFLNPTSITLGRNNLPLIAYIHQADSDLRVTALGNIFGSNYFVRR